MPTKTKKAHKPVANDAEAEAKAILAKMQANKDAGDCPFC